MLSNYLNFQFEIKGKTIKGFCLLIQDDFHETYAVVIDGYHSFCVWLDASSTWHTSKTVSLEPNILERIINYLSLNKEDDIATRSSEEQVTKSYRS